MLYLVGVGINEYDSLSIKSIEILKNSHIVYLNNFTSHLSSDFALKIKNIFNPSEKPEQENKIKVEFVERWFVEDVRDILKNSIEKNICILIYGDPLVATTYTDLLSSANKQGVKYKVIHSASGIISLIGESGLHYYKFGKMVTMMSDPMSSITVYDTIYNNMCLGLHTLILTEYNNDRTAKGSGRQLPFYLHPKKVFELLIEREKELKLLNLTEESFAIIASKIGTKDSKILSGKIKSLCNVHLEDGFNSVIIPGTFHFTEIDSIKNLTVVFDEPTDNSGHVDRMSERMLKKYIPNAKKALDNLNFLINSENNFHLKEYDVVLENAENYILDAENFYKQGKLELAILSIGYAEGLIDSLRFQKGMNPW